MIKHFFKFFFIIILFYFLNSNLYPQTKNNISEYNSGNIRKFIGHLISQKEFYRAYIELKRLNTFYPESISAEQYYTTELFLLFSGKQFDDIIKKDFPAVTENLKIINSVFKTDAYLEKKEFAEARNTTLIVLPEENNTEPGFFLFKRILLSNILLGRPEDTSALFKNQPLNFTPEINNFFSQIHEMNTTYKNSFKKPYIASLLGIIPGMGYVYSGKPATGVIALMVISVLSGITYYSFKTDNKPIGIFVGIGGVFFYGGSIVGGYLSTKKYNDVRMNDYTDSLFKKMNLSEDRLKLFNKYGIKNK